MKNFIRFSILSLVLFFSNFGFSQSFEVTNADVLAIAGKQMKGQLTYANYSNDGTGETLKCELTTSIKKGRLRTEILFEEKDKKGRPYEHNSSIKISQDNRTFHMGKDKWIILESMKTQDELKIVAVRKGKDANKKADLKMTVNINKEGSISWKSEVRYAGTKEIFLRNQYSFSK